MYKLFVALRYLRANKVIYFSIAGVAIGIMAMILVTSVMGGFSRDIRARIRGFQAHLTVSAQYSDRLISDYDALTQKIRAIPHVTGASPRIEYPAWISYRRGAPRSVVVFGVDPAREAGTSELQQYFARGGKREFTFAPDLDLEGGSPGIVTGSELRVRPGDPVTLETVRAGDMGPAYLAAKFVGAGSFKSGMAEYDAHYLFCDLAAMQEFMKLAPPHQPDPVVNQIAVAVDDYETHGFETRRLVAEALHGRSGTRCLGEKWHKVGRCGGWIVETWEQTRSTLLSAVAVERGIQIIMLFIIVIVAGFNIIAIYTMMVRAKTHDVGILRSLGATRGGVTLIFLLSGGLCGLFGSFFGILAGLLLSQNLNGIVAFVRVTSRELNKLAWAEDGSRLATMFGVGLLALAFAALIFSWHGLYRAFRARAWIWAGLAAALVAGSALVFFQWVPQYTPWPDSTDPASLPASLPRTLAIVGAAALLLWTAVRRLTDRHRETFLGGFVRIVGTVFYAAYTVAFLGCLAVGVGLLIARPELTFAGWDLFPRDVYYLDRVPVLVDPVAILSIVIATLVVSLVFSIYPAIRAATYDPVEAIRHE